MDPEHLVQSIRILNFDAEKSTIAPPKLISKQTTDSQSYIVSDADEELLILVIFREITDLESITLHAISIQDNDEIDASPPKTLHIYKINNFNINFNNILSIKPNKSFQCDSSKLSLGQSIKFKTTSIKYLAIYIESNQNDTEKTVLNGIEFITETKHKYNQIFKDPFQAFFNLSSQITNITDTMLNKCICGDYLREINGIMDKSQLYNGQGYHCDICRKQSYEVEIFWHCDKGQITAHPGGFDICNECVSTYNPETYQGPQDLLTGIKDSFGMDYQIKYKPASTQVDNIKVKNVAVAHLPFNLALQIQDVTVLGSDPDISTINGTKLIWNGQITPKSYIVSEPGEQLTIFIEFGSNIIDLYALTIHISSESVQYIKQNDTDSECKISGPDVLSMYKVQDLADIFDLDPLKADKSVNITSSKTEIRNISNTFTKYKDVQYLAILLSSKEENDDRIYLNAVECQGQECKKVTEESKDNEQNLDQEPISDQDTELKSMKTGLMNNMKSKDSTYLLESVAISNQQCDSVKISDCPSMKRLIAALMKYTQFIANKGNKNDNTADRTQHVTHLDDFHHLQFAHSHQFEDIYNVLNEQIHNNNMCDLRNCVMIQRNNRNRSFFESLDVKLEEMYFNYKNIEDIVGQQILDKIHCYYLHSFDIGYKMRRKETEHLRSLIVNENDDKKEDNDDDICNDKIILQMNENQICKRWTYRNIKGLERIQDESGSSKFCTTVNDKEDIRYSNGIRYFYWKCYENNHNVTDPQRWIGTKTDWNKFANEGYTLGAWYIHPIFEDLKSELINNTICSMSNKQWDILVNKANIHLSTYKAKSIQCKKYMADAIYNIKYKDVIHADHLIAMMVYCNQDVLQRKFSETYRRIPEDECDESMIKRHSNYGHLGRLLRECVECFGVDNKLREWRNGNLIIRSFWHGINIKANFSSSVICIKGPASTSTEYSVAVNFCANTGLILEFNLDKYWCHEMSDHGIALFECCWISDYANEQEAFFIGGYSNFMINTIIEPNGLNYRTYIQSINQFHQLLMSKYKEEYNNQYVKTVEMETIKYRLLSHQLHLAYQDNDNFYEFKSIPPYIEKLVDCQFKNIENIEINYDILFETNKGFEYFFRNSFFNDKGWIYWDRLKAIFPSLMKIHISSSKYSNIYWENGGIYETILFHLQMNDTLKIIVIYMSETINMEKLNEIWLKYVDQFDKLKWKMSISESGLDLRSTQKLIPLFQTKTKQN